MPLLRYTAKDETLNAAGVYRIRNTVTGGFYVGSSVKLRKRLRLHESRLRRGGHPNAWLQNSFDKHGADAFVFEVLAVLEADQTLDTEQRLLDRFVGDPHCYNIAKSATAFALGLRHSPETRERIGKAVRGTKRAPRTPEHSERIAAQNRGRPLSPEHRAKLSAARKGRPKSAEWKAARSATMKEAWRLKRLNQETG